MRRNSAVKDLDFLIIGVCIVIFGSLFVSNVLDDYYLCRDRIDSKVLFVKYKNRGGYEYFYNAARYPSPR